MLSRRAGLSATAGLSCCIGYAPIAGGASENIRLREFYQTLQSSVTSSDLKKSLKLFYFRQFKIHK